MKYAQNTSVRQLIQKINHLIPSVQNQNKCFGMLETSNYVNCSRRNPKTQCKVCLSYWDIGIVSCTCGHFLRKGSGDNQKFIKYTMDFLAIPDNVIKKGRPHGHWKKKCKKIFQGIHDRFIRDETPLQPNDQKCARRRCMSTNGCSCGQRSYPPFDPTRILTISKVIGGFVRTRQVPILCRYDADLTSNKHCLPCSN